MLNIENYNNEIDKQNGLKISNIGNEVSIKIKQIIDVSFFLTKILDFSVSRNEEIKNEFANIGRNGDLKYYIKLRNYISDIGKTLSGSKKMACYELAACMMNARNNI